MEDNSLLHYENSLKELEKQKESLELVMKKMGAEWEESGAGIGWMGDLPISFNSNTTHHNIPPLLQNVQSVQHTHQPSHDYLQALLHVNEAILAESLASNQQEEPLLTPQSTSLLITPPIVDNSTTQKVLDQLATPPITPDDD